MHKQFYNCYDKNKKFLGSLFCKASEICNELPDAKYIKVLKKPWNNFVFKEIDEEILDMKNEAL